eukprot:CAMPEP_0117744742 /NCGR_PEP_ID=MMETSP0947-20121206/6943_1 /TAXON_ID=44440 /ORGANISM="Chattonella subsalsa, Strain CCMP2191" /LENGTH=149 /DNA_ID=CAMNT_0005561755 /DNA_START=357 /DNA_END=807 /DNA_ORIENTATION=-
MCPSQEHQELDAGFGALMMMPAFAIEGFLHNSTSAIDYPAKNAGQVLTDFDSTFYLFGSFPAVLNASNLSLMTKKAWQSSDECHSQTQASGQFLGKAHPLHFYGTTPEAHLMPKDLYPFLTLSEQESADQVGVTFDLGLSVFHNSSAKS